ncbi:MAG: oligosaccharide flippase family protein [Candidatus Alcyoniella australis]|nr:oligosaccharide flippase family protein [Candidatus Alcyoniella australis]
MSRAASLLRGSGFYALGNLAPKLMALALIPIYTYLLSERQYGIVTYVTSLAAIMLALTELGFRSSVLRFYFDYEGDPARLKRFLGTSAGFLIAVGLLLTVAALATGKYWGPLLVKDTSMGFWPFLALGVLIAFCQLSHVVPMAMLRASERAGLYAILQIGEYLLIAGLVVLALVGIERSARAALWARFIAVAVFFVIMSVLIWRKARPALDLPMLKRSLIYGLPLTAHAVANWSQTFLDRVLLERMTSLDRVGLYSLGYNIGMLMSAINLAFNRAFLPYHLREVKNNPDAKRHLARVAEDYWAYLGLAAAFGVLFAREGIMLLTPERFYEAHRVVPWVIGGYLAHGMYYPLINNLLLLKRTGMIPLATAASAGLNVLLNLYWIPRWNIVGAAAATCASYLLLTLIVYLWSQRLNPMPYRLRRVALVLGSYAVIGLGVHLIQLRPDQLLAPLAIKAAVLVGYFWLLKALGAIDPRRALSLIRDALGRSAR